MSTSCAAHDVMLYPHVRSCICATYWCSIVVDMVEPERWEVGDRRRERGGGGTQAQHLFTAFRSSTWLHGRASSLPRHQVMGVCGLEQSTCQPGGTVL